MSDTNFLSLLYVYQPAHDGFMGITLRVSGLGLWGHKTDWTTGVFSLLQMAVTSLFFHFFTLTLGFYDGMILHIFRL